VGVRRLIVHPSKVEGEVKAPPSKSYTHRAIYASLLAGGVSMINNPLVSGHTKATMGAVEAFGASLHFAGDRLEVSAPSRPLWPGSVNAGNSATTLRIAMAVASLVERPSVVYGDESLNRRPVGPLARALRELGAEVIASPGDTPPVAVKGFREPRASRVEVDASISSQFLTALLMLSAYTGVEVKASRVSSKPYIDITIRVLDAYGVKFDLDPAEGVYSPRGTLRPSQTSIPGDWSSAAIMLVAGAIAGRVRVNGLSIDDVQGDKVIVDHLRAAGVKVRLGDGWVEAEAPLKLEPIDVNLDSTPDIAPPLAVLASYASGISILRGVSRLKAKESNRLEAIATNLARLGVEAVIACGGDCLAIKGGRPRGGVVRGFGDHRIIMSFAVAGLASERPVEVIDNIVKVGESYPGFLEDLKGIGGRVEVA